MPKWRCVGTDIKVGLLKSLPKGGTTIGKPVRDSEAVEEGRDRVDRQLSGLNAALTAFAGAYGGKATLKRRKMSARSRAKIAAAQRRRWAKFRK